MRFQCQPGCTECCRQKGYVYLTEEDIPRLAEFLGMSPGEFEKKHVYRTKNLRRLRIPRGRQCPFLLDEGCGVHPAKPLQCRAFPYWPEMMDDKTEWRKAAVWCPGIGKGELVQIETVREVARQMRVEHPNMYE